MDHRLDGEGCSCSSPRKVIRRVGSYSVIFCSSCSRRVRSSVQPRERDNARLAWRNDHGLLCCCFSCVMRRSSVGAYS